MADSKLFIGLDVGTQSTKGVLVDSSLPADRAVVARASVPYDLMEGLPPGAAEQHPHTWRDAVASVVGDLLKGIDLKSLGGIGISGQQHGLVVLDGKDEVIRPAKLWCDTTTGAEADAITKRSGRSVPTGFTLPKLLWMKNHEPENFARVESVLLPHDYINFLLTGKKFMEAGDASGSGAFDPKARAIDRELLAWVDPRAPGFFPDLVPADQPAGTVSVTGSALFGLPQGLLVSPGGGDNMMSAIGSGATHEGATVVSLGTSGTAFSYASQPVIDPEGEIAAFCDSTGAWMPLLCTMNVTGVTEEVVKTTGRSHVELTKLAAEVEPGCGGLLFLPYLAGERVPNLPDATGTLLGLRPGLMSPGHLFRAAIEGTSLGLASGIERMKRLGLSLSSVSVVGGGSKNLLWRQILADMLGVSVSALLEPESAALGGAIQALWVKRRAAGEAVTVADVASPLIQKQPEVAEPDASRHAVYRELLLRFESETKRLYL
jgi:D-xylulose kinase